MEEAVRSGYGALGAAIELEHKRAAARMRKPRKRLQRAARRAAALAGAAEDLRLLGGADVRRRRRHQRVEHAKRLVRRVLVLGVLGALLLQKAGASAFVTASTKRASCTLLCLNWKSPERTPSEASRYTSSAAGDAEDQEEQLHEVPAGGVDLTIFPEPAQESILAMMRASGDKRPVRMGRSTQRGGTTTQRPRARTPPRGSGEKKSR